MVGDFDPIVRVDMDVGAIPAQVLVQVQPAASQSPQRLRAEGYQHHGHAKFEERRHLFVGGQDRFPQEQDHRADQQQRRRVAEAPRGAYPRAAKSLSFAGDDRRNGNDVVGVGGVAKPEHEAQKHRRYKSAFGQVQEVLRSGVSGRP